MASLRRSSEARLALRSHLPGALLLGLFVLAYFWPVLVGGKILSPIAYLYNNDPWTSYAPKDISRYVNAILVDLPLVDYPWRVLARAFIHEGTFPAWNPYVLGGIPFYSNPQTGIFGLFDVPLWILPLTYALGVSAALKLFAGAFGAYLLVRRLGLDLLPGVLAGIAFAFSAFNIVWLTHDTLPAVAVMLPWAIWLVERIFERGGVENVVGLAIAIAIGLGGGHPGVQVHLLFVTALYACARAAVTRDRRRQLGALALVGCGLAAGVGLMAFMLLPELRSSHGTVGVLARKAGLLPGEHMPLAAIRTVLFPDWWGRPSSVELAGGPVLGINYNERTFYAGAVALLLACAGLLPRAGWRRKAPFALLAFVGLAIPLRMPGLHGLVTHLPVLESVQSQRLHFAFAFAVAVLAAFGLQAVLARQARWRALAVAAAAVLLGVLVLAKTHVAAGEASRTLRHFLSGTDYPLPGVLALTSAGWFLLFAVGVAAALLLARARPRWRAIAAAALVVLAAADAYHFAHGFQPMGPESVVIPPTTPAIRYLERHRDDGRIVGDNNALPADWPITYRLEDVRGYDPPQPTKRMLRLWRVANPLQEPWIPFLLGELGRPVTQVLGVLDARYVIAPPKTVAPRSNRAALRPVYVGPDATIFENTRAASRAYVPARTIVSAGQRGTIAAIVERRFDPRTTAVVEADQQGASALSRSASAVRGSVAVVQERNASVTLRAHLARRGLVVLNDSLLDGWSVRVDGRPATALYVNEVMRGVIVPAGRHEIAWSYAVPGLRLGAILSLLTLLALILAWRIGRRRALLARRLLSPARAAPSSAPPR